MSDADAVRLTDAMAFAEGQRGHDLGVGIPRETYDVLLAEKKPKPLT